MCIFLFHSKDNKGKYSPSQIFAILKALKEWYASFSLEYQLFAILTRRSFNKQCSSNLQCITSPNIKSSTNNIFSFSFYLLLDSFFLEINGCTKVYVQEILFTETKLNFKSFQMLLLQFVLSA